jgi:uncharacterized protein (TIGR00369 family)
MVKKNMNETNKGFMKHNGGLNLNKINETNYEFQVLVQDIHLNSSKTAHGGFIATIADTGMGTTAHQVANNKRCVTINLNINYISPALLNDHLIGKIKVLKKTNTLVFINCEISNEKYIIAEVSGTWKILL